MARWGLQDAYNGVLYSIEGDWQNATFSFAAVVPFAGWGPIATKYFAYAVKGRTGRTIHLLVQRTADGLVSFGDRSQLRRAIHLTDVSLEAHHLIPWGKSDHALIQNLAKNANKGSDFFHMNNPRNGIAIEPWRQSGGHSLYNNRVGDIMTGILRSHGTTSGQKARLVQFQDYLYTLIKNNPTTHLDNLVINFNP